MILHPQKLILLGGTSDSTGGCLANLCEAVGLSGRKPRVAPAARAHQHRACVGDE
jgi:hypothetical protein